MAIIARGPGFIVCGPDAEGSGVDRNGKLWRWDFHEYCGPLFLKKNGDPLKNQPMTENHPAWAPFEAWLRDRSKSSEDSE